MQTPSWKGDQHAPGDRAERAAGIGTKWMRVANSYGDHSDGIVDVGSGALPAFDGRLPLAVQQERGAPLVAEEENLALKRYDSVDLALHTYRNGSAAAAFGAGTSSKPVTTRALATRELTARPTADRSRLPEVVVDPVRRVQTAERQLHAIADLHRLRVHVRHLALEAAA